MQRWGVPLDKEFTEEWRLGVLLPVNHYFFQIGWAQEDPEKLLFVNKFTEKTLVIGVKATCPKLKLTLSQEFCNNVPSRFQLNAITCCLQELTG